MFSPVLLTYDPESPKASLSFSSSTLESCWDDQTKERVYKILSCYMPLQKRKVSLTTGRTKAITVSLSKPAAPPCLFQGPEANYGVLTVSPLQVGGEGTTSLSRWIQPLPEGAGAESDHVTAWP